MHFKENRSALLRVLSSHTWAALSQARIGRSCHQDKQWIGQGKTGSNIVRGTCKIMRRMIISVLLGKQGNSCEDEKTSIC